MHSLIRAIAEQRRHLSDCVDAKANPVWHQSHFFLNFALYIYIYIYIYMSAHLDTCSKSNSKFIMFPFF